MVCAKKLINVVLVLILTSTLNTKADEVCLKAIKVSGGEYHTMVLMENNTVWACGLDSSGQLGNGDYGSSNILIQVHDGDMNTVSGYLEDIIAVDAGWYHSMALDENGYVWAWGGDDKGQLGNGSITDVKQTPIAVYAGEQNPGNPTSPLSNITCISAGRSGEHSLAADSDGLVYAWGYNSSGQCGGGNYVTPIQTAIKVKRAINPIIYLGDGTDSDIVEVDAGVHHSLARDEDGYVWEWGNSLNDALAYKVPGENGVGYLANIVEIASCNHSMALDADGHVWIWSPGGNPAKVPGGDMGTTYLENIVAIGVGNDHFLALDSFGFVWQWTYSNMSPARVLAGEQFSLSGYLEHIVALDAGYLHSLAIDETGVVYGWDSNSGGQLGVGTSGDSYETPMLMHCADTGLGFDLTFGADYEGGCVSPDDEVTLTISLDPNEATVSIVADIVVYLPWGLDIPVADPDTGVFDVFEHTYTWPNVTITPGNSITYTLTAKVNALNEPFSTLTAEVLIIGDDYYMADDITIPICCWGGDIIYVDDSATGANTGTSWQDAYVDLQSALARAQARCGDKIWVAQGVYVPGDAAGNTFDLITGVAVYGGFRGEETLLSQRDPVHYKSILSGNDVCTNVVTADDVDTTAIFDGFTVCAAAQDGVACTDGAEPVITACIIETNGDSGVYINASSPTLNQCLIKNNDGDGLEIIGSSSSAITHCIIDNNGAQGIYTGSAAPAIGNCFIKNNGGNGVSTANPSTAPIIYNVTLTLNDGMAIYQPGGAAANAYNCILWENNNNGTQYWGCDLTYSCYYDPVNPPSGMPDPNSNITANPSFVYDAAANGHLRDDSPCIDLGCSYTGCTSDVDLDGDDRVIDISGKGDGAVDIDMGCDEYECSELEHAWDFNQDSIINLLEFAPFAAAWLKDDSDQDWATHARCDFDTDDDVDLDDLCLFSEVWLWQACWRDADSYFAMMMRSGDAGILPALLTTAQPSPAELEAAKLTRWREMQPAFEPTPQYLLWQIEDIIDWLEKLWATDPDFRQDITEADFAEFLKHLYEERDELISELESKHEAAS